MKLLFTALVLLSLIGCATTRLGEFDNGWYIVGVEKNVEVQANHIPGELDTWYIRVSNNSEQDYNVLIEWVSIDYTNFVFQGWIEVPSKSERRIGYFQQKVWEINGTNLYLEDAMIKVRKITLHPPTE